MGNFGLKMKPRTSRFQNPLKDLNKTSLRTPNELLSSGMQNKEEREELLACE